MLNRILFSIFVVLMFVYSEPLSAQNGDCVGVHIIQWWDCASGTANAHAEPQGGTAPYIITWSNGDTGPNASGLTPGQYTVTVVDADSCLKAEVCIVVTPECCIWSNITTTPDDCQPGNNGQAVIWEIGGGVAPYTILLPNGTTKTNNGNTPVFLNNFAAGVWYITITDAAGCSTEQMIEIEQQQSPTVNLIANDLTCNTTTTTINTQVTGGPVTYKWNTNATTSSLSNVGPGIYSITVTNPSGCSDSDTIVISAPQQVTLHATATPTACGENNGIINVTTTASIVTVEAPNGAIFNLNGSATIDSLQSGVYEITATNSAGCTMFETAIVEDSQPAKDSIECVTICEPGFVNGIWVSDSITLTETLTNAQGCSFVFTTEVNFQLADTSYQSVSPCYGTPVTIGGNTYTQPATVPVITFGNCPSVTIWTITYSDMPDSISYPTVKICGGDSLVTYNFTDVIGNGCPELIVNRSFEHHPFTMEFSMTNTDTICGLMNRQDSLFRNITVDNVNCIIKQPFGLLVTNLPTTTITPGPTHHICGNPVDSTWVETSDVFNLANCSRDITGYWQVVGPKPAMQKDTVYTCLDSIAALYPIFTPGIDCNPDKLTIAIKAQKPDMEIVYRDTCNYAGQLPIAPIMINHPGNNCLGDTIIILNPHQSVTASRHENICDGESLVWHGDTISAPGTWTKIVGQTTFGCDSLETITVDIIHGSKFETDQDTCDLTVAGQKFWKTTTSPNGCVDSILVTLKWLPGFEMDSVKYVCRSIEQGCESIPVFDSLTDCWGLLNISSEYSPRTKSVVKYTCDINLAGTYTFATIPAQDSTQCDTLSYFHWVLAEKPDMNAKATDNKCHGDENGSIELTVSGGTPGYTYNWEQSWVMGNNPMNLPAGTYTVTVTDAKGCSNSTTATVTEPDPITVNASGDDAECDGSGGSLAANANGGTGVYSYLWSNGLAMPFGNANAGTYTVTVTDANGCTNSTTATVWAPTLPTIETSFDSIGCNNPGRVYSNLGVLQPGTTIRWYYNGVEMPGTTDSTSVLASLPGNYTVVVTNEYGCTASATVFVPAPYCPRPKLPCELLITPNNATHAIHVTLTPDGFDQSDVQRVDWVVFSPLDPQGSGQAGFSSSADFEVLVQHLNVDPETWYIQVKNIRINNEDYEPESGSRTKFCVKFH